MTEKNTVNADTEQQPTKERRSLFAFDERDDSKADVSWVVDSLPDDLQEAIEPKRENAEFLSHESEEDESDDDRAEDPQASDDDQDEDEEEEQEKPRKRKKNRVTAEKRIAELTRKAKEFQAIAQEAIAQKTDLERRLTSTEHQSLRNQEQYLEAQKAKVKDILVQAAEEGDARRQAEAIEVLSQYNEELANIRTLRQNSMYRQAPQPRYAELDYDIDEPQDSIDPEYRDIAEAWLKKNSWADQNSRNFDARLMQKADEYSVELASAYKLEGRGDEIGNADFWQEITSYMNDNFKVRKTAPKMAMKAPSGAPMTSPGRRSSSAESNPRIRREVILTPEQKEVARSLRGIIRDERGNRIMDAKGAEAAYARQLMRGN